MADGIEVEVVCCGDCGEALHVSDSHCDCGSLEPLRARRVRLAPGSLAALKVALAEASIVLIHLAKVKRMTGRNNMIQTNAAWKRHDAAAALLMAHYAPPLPEQLAYWAVMTPSGDITRLAPIGVTHDHERLSDERVAVMASAVCEFRDHDVVTLRSDEVASVVTEIQEYRSPIVRAQIAFAEAEMRLHEARIVEEVACDSFGDAGVLRQAEDNRAKSRRDRDEAFAALRAALGVTTPNHKEPAP